MFKKYLKLLNEFANRFTNLSKQTDHSSLLPPPQIWSRVLIWSFSIGSITLITWSFLVKVNDTLVLSGEITTDQAKARIISKDGGVINTINVKPFSEVKKGDLIVSYSDNEVNIRLKGLESKLTMLKEQYRDTELIFDYKIQETLEQMNLDIEIGNDLKLLVELGAVERTKYLSNKVSIVKSEIALSSLASERKKALSGISIEIESTKSSIKQLLDRKSLFRVYSPIDGFIQDMRFQNQGERIMPGEEIASIIPKANLIARVNIPSSISAPLELGLEAVVDIDAYPSSDYGSINAILQSYSPMTVSSNSQTPVSQKTYIADLKLAEPTKPDYLSRDDLKPGMIVSARLKLREKPIISTIFNIFDDMFSPLSERSR